ncbi:LutC/YkgG family protein [Streptomyces sp. NPDC004752]
MTPTTPSSSRELVLARIRAATADVPAGEEAAAVDRTYRQAHIPDGPGVLELLAENLADYRAHVHRTHESELAARLARLLTERGTNSLVVPEGLPWSAALPENVALLRDSPPLSAQALDAADSVITGCAVAIAETGTIVLDATAGQGRRALTLVPDHHICIVHAHQVVASVPQALTRLDPTRAQTWISGPSATSDIELDRVEGVHGPRTLDVVLMES